MQRFVVRFQKNTPCSFVSLDERGERSFLFYNRNMADTAFSESDIDYTLLQQTRSFHVTSFMFAETRLSIARLSACITRANEER